jgi:hypothetical protein
MDRILPIAAAAVLAAGLLLRFLAGRRLRAAHRSSGADAPADRPEAPEHTEGDR